MDPDIALIPFLDIADASGATETWLFGKLVGRPATDTGISPPIQHKSQLG